MLFGLFGWPSCGMHVWLPPATGVVTAKEPPLPPLAHPRWRRARFPEVGWHQYAVALSEVQPHAIRVHVHSVCSQAWGRRQGNGA